MPQPNDLSRSLVAPDQDSTIIAVVEMSRGYPPQNGLFQLAAVAVSTPFSAAADCRHSPLCRQTEAASGYSELIRGKGSCHLISPILWRSALVRSAWRHGMGHDGDVDGGQLISMSPCRLIRSIRSP